MAKGGKSAEDYLSDLASFKGKDFRDWKRSATDLRTECQNVKAKENLLKTSDEFERRISGYQIDKADKGANNDKTLRGWVTEIEGTLEKKMDKTHADYSRKANLAQNATLQDCINDAKGQIDDLEKKLFPNPVSGKRGDFSPSLANASVTGLSVGMTATSLGVTGLEISVCGLCVMGAGLASAATGADCTTHTAGTYGQAIWYFVTGGLCKAGVSEDNVGTVKTKVGAVDSTVASALTHVGPYIKF